MVKLFIFRRDLRVTDNTALNLALDNAHKDADTVLPIFIFTPEQVSSKNEYKSKVAVSFMIKSLSEIRNLQCFHGDNVTVLKHLFRKLSVTGVYFNADHTHYAQKRDKAIAALCEKKGIPLHTAEDYNLHPMGSILTGSDSYYSVFTPFYNKATSQQKDRLPEPPHKQLSKLLHTDTIESSYAITLEQAKKFVGNNTVVMLVKGGRAEAMGMLSHIELQKDYHNTRDEAPKPTTYLSAHIKFGTISIREAYRAFKKIPSRKASDALVRQLYWNEFYDQLMHHLPYERTLGKSNYKQLKVRWGPTTHLQAWKDGKTGFPFIDAGMRQLNAVGWMHNRARLAVAIFLAMQLLIDWRKGEKYFATKLLDYDVSQNNGNWQWSCGVGVDRTGYLRMYNPFSQSKSHDPNCEYIRKYVPELKDTSNEDIHDWETAHKKYKGVYIQPIVDYKERRKIAIESFKGVE